MITILNPSPFSLKNQFEILSIDNSIGFVCSSQILLFMDNHVQDMPYEKAFTFTIDDFILKIAPIQTEDANYEDIYENLFTIYQNPLDLNKADIADLRALFFLTESQINAI
jgi:hypothetical protein